MFCRAVPQIHISLFSLAFLIFLAWSSGFPLSQSLFISSLEKRTSPPFFILSLSGFFFSAGTPLPSSFLFFLVFSSLKPFSRCPLALLPSFRPNQPSSAASSCPLSHLFFFPFNITIIVFTGGRCVNFTLSPVNSF